MSNPNVFDQIDLFVKEQKPNVHYARIGEIVTGNLNQILAATALGTCVAVILYDSLKKIAGLAHIALPSSQEISSHSKVKPAKFADIAIPNLIMMLKELGAWDLKAKLAGGAEVVRRKDQTKDHIGIRNAAVVKSLLKEHGIPIIAHDLGGQTSRSVNFNINTEVLEIRVVISGKSFEEYGFEIYSI
ncbi:MAG: chemotaxis protein CheD [Candidatus Heimdallarchaeota archaeon]|nr:chemotaxis protein CheD [Candidatus Heimdallarchaeota archaeon]